MTGAVATGAHTLPDGRTVHVVEIAGGGLRARVSSLGATLLSLWVPDASGQTADVVLGHASLRDYVADPAYLGVAVGRTAGRIAGARIVIDGQTHALDVNDGENTLHGGPHGLHALDWDVVDTSASRVVLEVTSPDGQGGYPGTLRVRLALSLAGREGGGALRLDWTAEATDPTPAAFAYHPYLNLDGHDAGPVDGHVLSVPAEARVELGPDLTTTGRAVPVAGTAFDLRAPRRLREMLGSPDLAGGLDHDWLVLPLGAREVPLRHAARLDGVTRRLDVWTSEPCVHLYDGAFLDVTSGKDGARYGARAGLAVETQPPPDATRHAGRPGFPDVVLRPGETLRSQTEYRFSAL